MCPKYAVDLLDLGLVRQMVEKSGGAKRAVLDDKGLNSAQKREIKAALDELGVEH
jgi:D-tyrosyl-tRNA(Tyr) deacylase